MEILLDTSTQVDGTSRINNLSIKRRIYYNKDIEVASFVDIDPDSIKELGKDSHYDTKKYEICTIEEDLFNIEPFIRKNRQEIKDGASANASVEIKVKCGLLNFRGIPSLFKMKQKIKARIKYLHTLEPLPLSYSSIEHRSEYDPCNFFKIVIESVRNEILNLSSEPQNNIRLFINSFEVDPSILKKEGRIFDAITQSIVDSRTLYIQILKLQALAAGQQFVGSAIYSAIQSTRYLIDTKPTVKHGELCTSHSVIEENLMTVSKCLHKLVANSPSKNAYKVQHIFQLCGKMLLFKLIRMFCALLLHSKKYKFSSKNSSLSLHRSKLCLFNSIAMQSTNSVKYLKRSNGIFNGPVGLDQFESAEIFSRKLFSVLHHYKHYRNVTINQILEEVKITYTVTLAWINLYLTGRVAMDLSVIMNILYNSNDRNIMHRISLVDVNIKSMSKIYR
ncbi:hypothetical protein BEWA_052800 [Theileria equi strain WA]|uniref:Inositol-pentakisphosphate 2-kinase n=1 Tax=Theileria equi strain WA TaxID=1537102 RepID=L1LD95_THEEQ|nr:hypothetical protein BEWA_052800 [Theileria equi strain WA]EKX73225.1 hypothetical protein BEWA_052800 [Theileria equi strain WA]|eukprot:XP_004832677.1 hypothetical protein BEWA_052800 [Theileria equi strain WA]